MAYYKVHNLREGGRDGNWEKATGKKANLCHNILYCCPLNMKSQFEAIVVQ